MAFKMTRARRRSIRHLALVSVLVSSGTPFAAGDCEPPLAQPPHELALSMLGLADAENFACEGRTPAIRLTFFTWTGAKKVLKIFFPEDGEAFIEIYEVGKAPSAVTLTEADKQRLRERFSSSSYWQLDTGFWMMPLDRDAAQQQQLLFVELSSETDSKLVWFDATNFEPSPLVNTMVELADTDFGPFAPRQPVVARVPAAPVITPPPKPEPQVADSPPANLLQRLAGTWEFTHGEQSGERVITPRFGGLVAEISETFANSDTQGVGLIAYDPTRNEYLETMTFNVAGAIGVLQGVPDAEGRRVTFTPLFMDTDQAPSRVVLTMTSEDHFFFQMQRQDEDGEWVITSQADFRRRAAAMP